MRAYVVFGLCLQVIEDLRKCLITFEPHELKAFLSLMNPDLGLDQRACKTLQLDGIFRLVESDLAHRLDGNTRLSYIDSPITMAAAMVCDLFSPALNDYASPRSLSPNNECPSNNSDLGDSYPCHYSTGGPGGGCARRTRTRACDDWVKPVNRYCFKCV